MTVKRTFKQRAVSAFVAMAMIFTMIPFSIMTAFAADQRASNRVADPSTMNDWTKYFPISGNLTTENAGKVWLDKSVFLDASAFQSMGIDQKSRDSFLIALSTIASSMSVKGMSNVPTDSVLILDVSGSMNFSQNDVAEELVEAANTSIKALLDTNKNNRVSVILYSDEGATTMLPLGRYETGSDGQYLTYEMTGANYIIIDTRAEYIGIDSDVTYEGTTTKPNSVRREVVGGTYMQSGLAEAVDLFLADNNSTVVEGTSIKRTPVMVLMSDGAPTYGTTSFTDPGDSNMGNGSGTSAALGFVTQLTAAYAKAKVEEKYGTECLFYTLGLGVGNSSVAMSVLDPQNANASTAVNDFWTSKRNNNINGSFDGYNNIAVGATVSVGNNRSVTKVSTPLDQYYVDKYFSAEAETLPGGQTITMADKLKQAFEDIVSEIQLQSAYFPTLIKESEDHSGFVSFVDRIGEYMEVIDVKGILIHDDFFSGADLASNFVASGGALGTYDNPSELGLKMVESVQNRLGITDRDVAETLIELAYRNKQLYYNNANDYSNYIGWYANAAGEFLGFYHEGVTVLPEPTGNVDTDPAFTVRSYGYLGEVDATHGVSKSDMMFATVQVRRNINTGEELVTFAVPAALIPVVNYEVTLDENDNITNLNVNGASSPIRLVYEVGLRSDINEFNVLEKVSSSYLADPHNINSDGSVNFYSNQWDHHNQTGYNTINTYSYFNPSKQNESYYYTADELIYSDTNGTVYTSTDEPTGDKYYAYTVYKQNGNLQTETVYRKIDSKVLEIAAKNADNTWYIPQGSVHINIGSPVAKTANDSGTLTDVLMPFVDTYGHTANDSGFYYYVGATLGNNGKLTVMPETGIKLSKTMAEGTAAPDTAFKFIITDVNGTTNGKTYTALHIDADGNETRSSIIFVQGVAVVELKAGEVIYIGGMSTDEEFRIEEEETAEYYATSAGLSPAGTIVPVDQTMLSVEFVNSARGKGSVVITKEVEHDYGTGYGLPSDLKFNIKVTLSGIGTANATFDTKLGGSLSNVTTDANGSFTVELAHGESFEIFGIYEGVVVTVVEQNVPSGFTPNYVEDGTVGDGAVTVIRDAKVSVEVLNSYEAQPVDPVPITVTANKVIRPLSKNWESNYEFEFVLEKYNSGSWTELGKVVARSSSTVTFTDAFVNEKYDKVGTYYYRITETEPDTPLGGFTYDKHVHSFSVVVTDVDMDGQLEISSLHTERPDRTSITGNASSGYVVNASFENVYSTSGSATATVEITKEINNVGGSDKTLAGYEFGLYDSTGALVEKLTTTERGFARFVLVYNAEDMNASTETFNYTIKEIVPTSVPSGWTYSTEELNITVSVVDNGNGTISAYVSDDNAQTPSLATNNIEKTFTNKYDPTDAELTVDFVAKELTGREMLDGEFDFEITGVTDPSMTPIKGTNTADGKVVFDSALKFDAVGTYVFNIVETGSDGNGLTLDKTVYRVVVTVSDNDGQLSASYIVTNDADNKIVFKNTYTPTPVTYTYKGTKILHGRPLLNDEFTFVLTEFTIDGVDVVDPKSYETKNLINGEIVFEALTFTKEGKYRFKLYEKSPEGNTFGVEYDERILVLTLEVVDDGRGSLYIDANRSSALSSIVFENVYTPAGTSATINGDKTLTGKVDNALKGDEFEFILYESNSSWDYSDTTKLETVSNKAGGTFEFTKIDFNTDEDRYYVVVEKNGGQTIDGTTYDSTVYHIYVEVTDDHKGQLHAKLHIYDKDGIPEDSVSFVNVYEITGTNKVELSGEKIITGRDFTPNDMFTFELYKADDNYQIDGNSPITSADMNSTTHRYQLFIEYTPDDVGKTFYYVVKEKNAGQKLNGITYSDVEYKIMVVVEDNGDGTIKTTVTVIGATNTTLDFENVYSTEDAETVVSGDKVLEGPKELLANDFTFELYEANENYEIQGNAISTVKNDANGKFEFDKIEFSGIGNKKYYYVVKESSANPMNNVVYDTNVYHVMIAVTDNGNGTLTVSDPLIVKVNGSTSTPSDKISFVNVFVPDPADIEVEINIDKTVVNKGAQSITPEGFEFVLDPAADGASDIKVKSDANGKAKITLEFSKIDAGKTFNYKLSETNDGRMFVEYSKAVYDIAITVTHDQATNTLVATLKVNNGDVNEINASFENAYDSGIPDSPQTGVDSNIGLWTTLMVLSGGTAVALTAIDSKKKKKEE